jgi:Putative peptidoglycan binding domain
MRTFGSFRWLVAAAFAASLPVTAPAVPGHSMGGFAGGGPHHSMGVSRGGGPHHSMGGFGGGGFHHSMGVPTRGGPRAFMGQRFGHDGHFFNDHRFVNHDRFFDNHQFVDNRFVNNQFVNNRFDDHFFFRHHNNFVFVFDFVSFGFPVGFPVSFPGWYPAYTGYPYDYSYAGYRPVYDDQYWTNLALAVQSELAQRGYYHGAIDGEIGSDSREAIRAFQEAQGLPVTGKIGAKLLDALGIKYKTA